VNLRDVVPLGQNETMLETLYKTKTPEASVLDGECYELILDAEPVNGRVAYFVREIHGWWDENEKRFVNKQYTLSPEEGYVTFEEAHERYKVQRLSRAESGFRHSFSPHYYGEKPYEYQEIV
jgi:hypothetical protein